MVTINIDGIQYQADPEKNLLETCLELGFNIPHFCYHPALGSVGACRLCAVKKFKNTDDKHGHIIMSCMEPIAEGLIISTKDEEILSFRATIIEVLMTNHPHDCPVCDEGGECHLQDMTVMTGHNYRHFEFKKRTYTNQYLGPLIKHEMNRCIQCYRCERFYRDYAGGKDLSVFGAHNHIYFGRFDDGPLENEFSGNLVEVCPTGVFTDKTAHKRFTRKWDLAGTPSVCTHCSLGCNIIAGERYGTLRRISNRYHGDINGYFLCDRGRFGYEYVYSDKRIIEVRLRKDEKNFEALPTEKLDTQLKEDFAGKKHVTGIGSPAASLEANYALLSLVGKDNFYHGVSRKEHELTAMALDFMRNSGVGIPTLKQMETADVVLILGEDLVNTAPRMALAVRQSARNALNPDAEAKKIPDWEDLAVRDSEMMIESGIYIATPHKDSLDDVARDTFRGSYGKITVLASLLTSLMDGNNPSPANPPAELVIEMVRLLQNAARPLIITGVTCGDKDIMSAAFNVCLSLMNKNKPVMLGMVFPESNSTGLAQFSGNPFEMLLENANENQSDTLVILENDLFRRAGAEQVDAIFGKFKQVVVLDQLENDTTRAAGLLLPLADFSRSEGTLVNNEVRAQRFYKAIPDEENTLVKENWRWLNNLKQVKEKDFGGWQTLDEVFQAMLKEVPAFAVLKDKFPDEAFRLMGRKVPRESFRYSGRTSIHAAESVRENKPPEDINSPLAFSMEGAPENPPSSLVTSYWSPGWNSVQASHKYLVEINGALKGGNPGTRLFDKAGNGTLPYYQVSSSEAAGKDNEWSFFPVYRIFGSEELSAAAAALSERIGLPFLLLHPDDAVKAGISENDETEVEVKGVKLRLRAGFDSSLPGGVVGISVNLPGMPYLDLPAVGKIKK